MKRRSFLRVGLLGGLLSLPRVARAEASGDGLHVRYGRLRGTWLDVPREASDYQVKWNWVDPNTPDTLGLLDADTEVVGPLPDGLWLASWNLTYESHGQGTYKTSLAVRQRGHWDTYCDGNEIAASGGAETTLVGATSLVSDGTTLLAVNTRHDRRRPVRLSEREYECSLTVSWLRGLDGPFAAP